MKPSHAFIGAGLFAGIIFAGSVLAKPEPASAALVARGSYLVNGIAGCQDCHTPHGERGEPILEKALQGAPLPFQPTVPMPWAPIAPAIAGFPNLTSEQAKHFLMTGLKPDGTMCRPPMPAYRFNAEDAEAVVAYIKSLGK